MKPPLTLGITFPPNVRMGDVCPTKSEQQNEETSKAGSEFRTTPSVTIISAKGCAEKKLNLDK